MSAQAGYGSILATRPKDYKTYQYQGILVSKANLQGSMPSAQKSGQLRLQVRQICLEVLEAACKSSQFGTAFCDVELN